MVPENKIEWLLLSAVREVMHNVMQLGREFSADLERLTNDIVEELPYDGWEAELDDLFRRWELRGIRAEPDSVAMLKGWIGEQERVQCATANVSAHEHQPLLNGASLSAASLESNRPELIRQFVDMAMDDPVLSGRCDIAALCAKSGVAPEPNQAQPEEGTSPYSLEQLKPMGRDLILLYPADKWLYYARLHADVLKLPSDVRQEYLDWILSEQTAEIFAEAEADVAAQQEATDDAASPAGDPQEFLRDVVQASAEQVTAGDSGLSDDSACDSALPPAQATHERRAVGILVYSEEELAGFGVTDYSIGQWKQRGYYFACKNWAGPLGLERGKYKVCETMFLDSDGRRVEGPSLVVHNLETGERWFAVPEVARTWQGGFYPGQSGIGPYWRSWAESPVSTGTKHVGWTFYNDFRDVEYNLSGGERLKALEYLAPLYGLGSGGVAAQSMRGFGRALRFKLRGTPKSGQPNAVRLGGETMRELEPPALPKPGEELAAKSGQAAVNEARVPSAPDSPTASRPPTSTAANFTSPAKPSKPTGESQPAAEGNRSKGFVGVSPEVEARAKPPLPPPVSDDRVQARPGKARAAHELAEKAERELALTIHSLPDEVVILWGKPIGSQRNDVVSYNMKDGMVTLWDAKARTAPKRIQGSNTFAKGKTLDSALGEAERSIGSSMLSDADKSRARQSLKDGHYRLRTVGAENAKNSIIQK